MKYLCLVSTSTEIPTIPLGYQTLEICSVLTHQSIGQYMGVDYRQFPDDRIARMLAMKAYQKCRDYTQKPLNCVGMSFFYGIWSTQQFNCTTQYSGTVPFGPHTKMSVVELDVALVLEGKTPFVGTPGPVIYDGSDIRVTEYLKRVYGSVCIEHCLLMADGSLMDFLTLESLGPCDLVSNLSQYHLKLNHYKGATFVVTAAQYMKFEDWLLRRFKVEGFKLVVIGEPLPGDHFVTWVLESEL